MHLCLVRVFYLYFQNFPCQRGKGRLLVKETLRKAAMRKKAALNVTNPRILPLLLFALLAFGGCQQDRGGNSQTAAKGGATGGEPQASVVFKGEELPITRVSCTLQKERQTIKVTFNIEPDGWMNLTIMGQPQFDRQSPHVALKLPGKISGTQDFWRSEEEESLAFSDTGVNGSFLIERVNKDPDDNEPGLLEVNVVC